MNTYKATIRNPKTGQTMTRYCYAYTEQEAVNRFIAILEDNTPIGELPDYWEIMVTTTLGTI